MAAHSITPEIQDCLDLIVDAANSATVPDDRQPLIHALQCLSAAPPGDLYDLALLRGLSFNDKALIREAVGAILARLRRFAEDGEALYQSMRELMEYCFIHLAQEDIGPADGSRVLREQAAGEVLRRVMEYLESQPDRFEGLRSWLLARIPDLQHSGGYGILHRTLVAFQERLAAAPTPSGALAAEIDKHRRLNAYRTTTTSQSTLRAYLDGDACLNIADTSQEYFQAYRILLTHEPTTVGDAMLQAMKNLIRWLDQTPQGPDNLAQIAETALVQRMRSVPANQMKPSIARHLEAHIELLPGRAHQDDLLRSVMNRFDRAQREPLFTAALEVLRRLPAVRYRSEEIEKLVLAEVRTSRTHAMWSALLALVAYCAGAPENFRLRPAGDAPPSAAHERAVRKAQEDAERMRKLLYRLATDAQLRLHQNAEIESRIRTEAWRLLLRGFPPGIDGLLGEGLLGFNQRLMIPTLEEASRYARRNLWPVILAHEPLLLGDGLNRTERVASVVDFFRATRDYTAVQASESSLGPLLRCALDDPDAKLRERAENALFAAGYPGALQRERQRRLLIRLQADLAASQQRINQLEKRAGELLAAVREVQDRHDRADLAAQSCRGAAAEIVTEAAIRASRLQIQIEELQMQIVEATRRAVKQQEFLDQLRQAIKAERKRSAEEHAAVQDLARRADAERANAARMESQRASLDDDIRQMQQRRSRVQPGTPDATQQIANLEAAIGNNRRRVRELEQNIALSVEMEARLRGEQNAHVPRIRNIEAQLAQLERTLTAGTEQRNQILRQIDELETRLRRLSSQRQAEEAEAQRALERNRQQMQAIEEELRGIQQQLFELNAEIEKTLTEKGRQTTISQNLAAELSNGRQEHERIAQAQPPENAAAQAAGIYDRDAHAIYQEKGLDDQLAYSEAVRHRTNLQEPLPLPQSQPEEL